MHNSKTLILQTQHICLVVCPLLWEGGLHVPPAPILAMPMSSGQIVIFCHRNKVRRILSGIGLGQG